MTMTHPEFKTYEESAMTTDSCSVHPNYSLKSNFLIDDKRTHSILPYILSTLFSSVSF